MTDAYERCGFMGERVLGFAYKVGGRVWEGRVSFACKVCVCVCGGGGQGAGDTRAQMRPSCCALPCPGPSCSAPPPHADPPTPSIVQTVVANDPEAYKTEEGAPPTTGLVFMGLIS